ncbi:MAG: DUF4402 domain-containing protein [Bacteroidales bacterium]
MKKSIIIIAAIFMTAFTTNVMAQNGATISANSSATSEIITPLSIMKTQDMNFGKLAVLAGVPGTCILTTAATRTPGGGVNLSNSTPTNSIFAVAGESSRNYAITLPSTITVTGPSGSSPMQIDNLKLITTDLQAERSAPTTSTIDGSGADQITVGGTLNVAGNQAKGSYTGPFTITIAYN